MAQAIETPAIDLDRLRQVILDEYALVADEPQHRHFLVGRPLALLLGYTKDWLQGIPEPTPPLWGLVIRSALASLCLASASSMSAAVAVSTASSLRRSSVRRVASSVST